MRRLWFLLPLVVLVTLVAAPAAAKHAPHHHPHPSPSPSATSDSPSPTPSPATPTPTPSPTLSPTTGTVTGPFTWQGATWCPNYLAGTTVTACNSTQTANGFTNTFTPTQVSLDPTGGITLAMSADGTVSGAVNTRNHQTWTPPETFTETLTVACDASGQVENWPAFWTAGTVGTWPAHGEIDIAEGNKGVMRWHYHYLSAAGSPAQVSGTPPGDWCGTHTYTATWTADAITFTWDGQTVGTVTAADTGGVPIATDPMFTITDYGTGVSGGPAVGGAQLELAGFSAVP